jgi:uncharacterized membrane protein YedE/YeeE
MFWGWPMRSTPVLSGFGFGLVFGAGLVISGMADPDRVKAFLDVAGAWNPALALVMGGAIAVAAPAFLFARRRQRALLGDTINLPQGKNIDARLLIGAGIFGLGWGLSGICPGPGVVLLGFGARGAIVFVLALLIGLHIGGLFEPRAEPAAEPDG